MDISVSVDLDNLGDRRRQYKLQICMHPEVIAVVPRYASDLIIAKDNQHRFANICVQSTIGGTRRSTSVDIARSIIALLVKLKKVAHPSRIVVIVLT